MSNDSSLTRPFWALPRENNVNNADSNIWLHASSFDFRTSPYLDVRFKRPPWLDCLTADNRQTRVPVLCVRSIAIRFITGLWVQLSHAVFNGRACRLTVHFINSIISLWCFVRQKKLKQANNTTMTILKKIRIPLSRTYRMGIVQKIIMK